MLEWLKAILGEGYNDEIDEKISKEIGKAFVSRKDFNDKVKLIGEHEKTIQEKTTELDNLRKGSPDVAALQQQLAEANAKLDKAELRHAAWCEAMQAGAKNPDTILLLSAQFLENAKMSDDKGKKSVEGYADFLKGLAEAEDTASLFNTDSKPAIHINGATPANPGNKAGAEGSASYEARLAEARKNGNTTEAVAIKNEAAAEGIYLM